MKYAVTILLSTLTFGSAVAAPDFYKPEFNKNPSFILEGRISMLLPTKNVVELNRFSNRKTWAAERVFRYSVGDRSLTLTVRELMAIRTDSLISQLAKLVQTYPDPVGMEYKIAQLDRNRFLVEPSKYSVKQGQALIRTLFIVNIDNTVQSIDFHANAAALKELKSVTELTQTLLNSVKTSTRKINTQPKAVVISSKDNKVNIKISLPKRYIMMFAEDSFSRTYFIQKLAPLGTDLQRISVRIGTREMLLANTGSLPTANNSTPIYGNLFGRSIEWKKSGASSQANGLTLKTIMRLQRNGLYTDEKSGHYIQVKVQADNERNLQAMSNLAATLKLDSALLTAVVPVHIPPAIVANRGDKEVTNSQSSPVIQSETPRGELQKIPQTTPPVTFEDRSANNLPANTLPENGRLVPHSENEELLSEQQTQTVPNIKSDTVPHENNAEAQNNYRTYQVPRYRHDDDEEQSYYDRHRYRRYAPHAEDVELDDDD